MAEDMAAAFAALSATLRVRKLWSGGRWLEGPAWLGAQGLLVFSDIPNDRMLAWSEADGTVATFRSPSRAANGNTTDRDGRLITCEQATRRVTRLEPDGALTVLADRVGGARFNAPNDVVVDSAGGVWFTDPDYGRKFFDGPLELAGSHVYRIAPDGSIRQMTDDMEQPNGLAFSPDERRLYVIDTGSTHRAGGPNHLRAFTVGADWRLAPLAVLHADPRGQFDGLRVDRRGWLWLGTGDGLLCLTADGGVLGRIAVPERVANLAFGGSRNYSIFLCATSSLYVVEDAGSAFL